MGYADLPMAFTHFPADGGHQLVMSVASELDPEWGLEAALPYLLTLNPVPSAEPAAAAVTSRHDD